MSGWMLNPVEEVLNLQAGDKAGAKTKSDGTTENADCAASSNKVGQGRGWPNELFSTDTSRLRRECLVPTCDDYPRLHRLLTRVIYIASSACSTTRDHRHDLRRYSEKNLRLKWKWH